MLERKLGAPLSRTVHPEHGLACKPMDHVAEEALIFIHKLREGAECQRVGHSVLARVVYRTVARV